MIGCVGDLFIRVLCPDRCPLEISALDIAKSLSAFQKSLSFRIRIRTRQSGNSNLKRGRWIITYQGGDAGCGMRIGDQPAIDSVQIMSINLSNPFNPCQRGSHPERFLNGDGLHRRGSQEGRPTRTLNPNLISKPSTYGPTLKSPSGHFRTFRRKSHRK
jgi:hypothetical protein